jgi:hypothetical protein
MSGQRIISAGSAPIVWSTVTEAFDRINANFTDLYLSTGGVSPLSLTSLTTSLVAQDNDTYDLGSSTKRWKNMYLSESISLGAAQISSSGLSIDLPTGTTVGGILIRNPDESSFKTVAVSGQLDVVANNFTGILNLADGLGIDITTTPGTDTITFTNTGVRTATGGAGISVSGTTDLTIVNTGVLDLTGIGSANGRTAGSGISVLNTSGNYSITNTGVLDIVTTSAGISISTNTTTGVVTVNNTLPAGNTFRSIAVSGQTTVTAQNSADTVRFIKGSGINVTTSLTKEVTFSNTGVLSLVAGNNITLSAGTGDITVGFNNRVDIIGSVFGDDSTMLVDGTNGVLRGTHIGSLTGNVTGNVTGNTAGTHTGPVVGNVTGNLSGYHTGDTTGSVFAQDSSLMINGVDGKITGRVETTSVVASAYIQTATYANLSAITAAYPVATKGMIVFDDGTDQFRGYDGNSWVALN